MRRSRSIASLAAPFVVVLLLGTTGASAAASQTPADGSSWTIDPTPNFSTRNDGLGSVSCTGPKWCMAMGKSFAGSPFSEIWDGTAWSLRKVPMPFQSSYPNQANFEDVSCTTPSACIAVGAYSVKNGRGGPLVDRWDGVAWHSVAVPQRRQSDSADLDGVSCLASGCMVVGEEWGGASDGPLAEWWDGSAWTIEPSIDQSDVWAYLGVSCTSPSFCIAAGWTLGPRLDRWDGHVWSSVPPVGPPGTAIGGFVSASCGAPTSCIAVANGYADGNETFPVADRWDGSAWSAEVLPHRAGDQFMEITGVSCSDANDCVAVGTVSRSNGYHMLIEHWNGVRWTMEPTPRPLSAMNESTTLYGVSCIPTSCVAVGETVLKYHYRTFAVRSNQ